jgi:hypothetical protein
MTWAGTGIGTAANISGPEIGEQLLVGYNPAFFDLRTQCIVIDVTTTQAIYAKAVSNGAVGSVFTVSGFAIRIA